MARLRVYKENSSDVTCVANRFIDEYMKDANDAQLKVYLYLIRMFGAGMSTSVSDMADLFNHTEKDILRALKYWEKKELLDLDYDESGSLAGIRLRECEECASKRTLNITAVSNEVAPVAGKTPAAVVPAPAPVKPEYSADDLKAASADPATQQLFFIAESYIGKPLTPAEMKTLLFIKDTLHFSEDLIDYLIQYCVDLGKKSFRYMETVAMSWAEAGITTPEEAAGQTMKYDKAVYSIMNALGKNGSPTKAEISYINRWMKEYGFDTDVIMEACDRTVLATDSHRFEYAEGILSKWNKEEVHHKADISRIDALFQRKKAQPKQPAKNQFNRYEQTTYNFEELEKQLLSN